MRTPQQIADARPVAQRIDWNATNTNSNVGDLRAAITRALDRAKDK